MRHLPLAALFVWAGLIFIGSSIPNPPDAGGQDWKYELAHVCEYTVFAFLAFQALRRSARIAGLGPLVVLAWLAAVAYGMSDEFHQSFVPNRDASWLDVGFDAIGAAIGTAVAALAAQLARGRSKLPLSRDRRESGEGLGG